MNEKWATWRNVSGNTKRHCRNPSHGCSHRRRLGSVETTDHVDVLLLKTRLCQKKNDAFSRLSRLCPNGEKHNKEASPCGINSPVGDKSASFASGHLCTLSRRLCKRKTGEMQRQHLNRSLLCVGHTDEKPRNMSGISSASCFTSWSQNLRARGGIWGGGRWRLLGGGGGCWCCWGRGDYPQTFFSLRVRRRMEVAVGEEEDVPCVLVNPS